MNLQKNQTNTLSIRLKCKKIWLKLGNNFLKRILCMIKICTANPLKTQILKTHCLGRLINS